MFDTVERGWRTGTLAQFLDRAIGGGTPSRENPAFWDGCIPWVSVKDVTKPNAVPQETITPEGLANSSSRLIPRRTNIIATRMAVGSVVRYDMDVAINQDLLALTPSKQLDPDFLYYWLNWKQEEFLAVATGTTVKGIRKDLLLSFSLDLPPINEQRRIANVLRSLEDVIANTRAVFSQQRLLKQKLAESLFRDGVHKADSKETKIGRMPAHWQLLEFHQIAESITVGIASSATHAYRADGIPLIRNQNIKAGHLDLNDLLFVSTEYDESYASKRVRVGDVITMRTGYPGKSAVVPPELAGCQTFTTLITRPNQSLILPRFLCEWINSDLGMREVWKRQAGGAQQNLNAGALKRLPVPVPPIEEQAEIAAVLDSFPFEDVAIKTLLGHQETLRADLLTGRLRVPA